jgi:hypothetical protein
MKPTEFIVETSQIAQEADVMHADHEVQMARSDCYSAAKYAIELHRMLKEISEQQGLDGWVSEKITLANDYLRTVHEYLMHEMAHGEEQAMMGFTAEAAEYAFDQLLVEDDYDDAVKDYFSRGGKVEKLPAKKPRKSEKTDFSSKHIGGKGEVGKGKANRIGKNAKTDPSGKPVVTAESDQKTMSRAAKGNEKYGKDGMKALAKAGREGASEKELDAIRDRHDRYNESRQVSEMATGGGSSSGGIATSMGGPGYKPTSGVPKKVGNAHKPKKVTVGKGIY